MRQLKIYWLVMVVASVCIHILQYQYPSSVWSSYGDDVLVIPLVMGLALTLQRWLIAMNTFSYSYLSIGMVWAYFSIVFECILPSYIPAYTQDAWDVLAYACGIPIFHFGINKTAMY